MSVGYECSDQLGTYSKFFYLKLLKASQDLRKVHHLLLHSTLECTTDGRRAEVRVNPVCLSFPPHSSHSGDLACSQTLEEPHHGAHPHSTFDAFHHALHQYDQSHWNLPRK